MKEIIGRKIGMTQVYGTDGTMYAVTVVEVLPNVVVGKKTVEKDGYAALRIGYEDKKEKALNKPTKGIYAKAGVPTKANLFELKGDELVGFEVGASITCDLFKAGDDVDVIGTSKGRGYSGVIKRWGHKIGPKAHGSGYHRQQGSFANNGRDNNRVIPGKKMSGHMGVEQATILNARVVDVNKDKNYILVSGGVPGPKKGLVRIRTAVKPLANPKAIAELLMRSKAQAESATNATDSEAK
jgi:large subunit ribosomal protein L3